MRYRHGDLTIDPTRLVVERAGEHVPVQPQVFDVLSYLLTNRDRLVPKEELLDEIWGDRFVSESTLTSRIKAVRKLLGDDGRTQGIIKTVHGRGYRWVADVVAVDDDTAPSPPPAPDQQHRDGSQAVKPRSEPLPRALTSFVGRAAETVAVRTALGDHRLVTIVGPPGVGKSRLAIEAVEGIDHSNDDHAESEGGTSVAFVDLRPTTDVLDVATTLHRSVIGHDHLGGSNPAAPLPDRDAVMAALVGRLSHRRVVVLLDNCEHVIAAVAAVGMRLLRSCDQLTILATSRRSLRADGEAVVVLEPLDVPAEPSLSWNAIEASTAGRLFVERATAAGALLTRSGEEARRIEAVCRRLDGLPLAIELAAARTRWFSLDDLLRQLDGDLDGSATGRRGDDPIQLALRSSRELLLDDEQRGFDALSAFAGSFTIDAAMDVIGAVCSDADLVEILGALIDHSLVDVVPGEPRRYRLLETTRRYAESCRLASASPEAAVVAHAEHYLRFVERRWPIGRISTEHPWSDLSAETTEIEAAVRNNGSVDRRQARRLLGALGWYWWFGGEAHRWEQLASNVADEASEDPPAVAAALDFGRALARVLLGQDPTSLAEGANENAMAAEHWSLAAWALTFTVAPDTMWMDLDAVDASWPEIVSLFRRSGDTRGEAWAAVLVLGYAQVCAGKGEEAAATYRAAAREFERCGDAVGQARALLELVELSVWTGDDIDRAKQAYDSIPETDLPLEPQAKYHLFGGLIATKLGNDDEALLLHQQALALWERELPTALLTNTYRCLTALAARRVGQLDEAARLFEATIELLDELRGEPGWRLHCPWVLESVIGLLVDLGELMVAARVAGAAQAIRLEHDAPMPYWDEPRYRPEIDRLTDRLGGETFAATRETGRTLGVTGVCDLVRATLTEASGAS